MKQAITIFITFIITYSAYAQVFIGGKVSGHLSRVQFEKVLDQGEFTSDLTGGFNGGAGITFPVTEPFSMHVELGYTQKRKNLNSNIQQTTTKSIYHMVEMPIMLRYEVLPSKGIYLAIGPNIGYWLSGSGSLNNLQETGTPISYHISFDPTTEDLSLEDPNRLQFALLVGLGTLLDMGDERKLMIETRLELGHSHLGGDSQALLETADYREDQRSKYQLISFNLGYFIPLHKKNAKNRSHTYKAKRRN